jgi:hypothetical protein
MNALECYEFTPLRTEYISHRIHKVAIVSTLYGAAESTAPVASDLSRRGIEVIAITSSTASGVFTKYESSRQEAVDFLYVDWVLCAGGTKDDFRAIRTIQASSPNAKVALIEQTPGQANDMVIDAVSKGIFPEIVFTTSLYSARRQFGNLHDRTFTRREVLIVPLGNPAFDRLQEIKHEKSEVRKILEIAPEEIMIVFAGRPDFERYESKYSGQRGPANSNTLKIFLRELLAISLQYPDKKICLVYRPHPMDKRKRWYPSVLQRSNVWPGNFRSIVSLSHHEQLESVDIALASDLVVTIRSTVADQVAVAASHKSNEELSDQPLILHLLLKSQRKFIEPTATHDWMPTLRLGSASYADTPEDIRALLPILLFSQDKQVDASGMQQFAMAYEYRTKSSAAQRIYRWLSLWEKTCGSQTDLLSDDPLARYLDAFYLE